METNKTIAERGVEEVIVIGSGFGGAVAACRLAQAGIGVMVIERGRRYEKRDFPALPNDSSLLPDLTRWTWQQNQGLWDIVDLNEMVAVQAAGYGGGSLIYANVHLRPPSGVFADPRWPVEYQDREKLDDYFNLAAFMMGAAPIDAHPKLANQVIKADQLKRAANQLGRGDAFFHPPLAVTAQAGPNPHGREQEACTGCGACCTGCPIGAKNTLDFNYLAIAEARGARVVTQCEVVNIEQNADDTWTVSCVDHLMAQPCEYRAKNLFLCAGAVHSTRLFARARLRHGGQGTQAQNLAGVGYYPNADAFGMVYETPNPQHPSFGPAITTTTVSWDAHDPASFFLIQDGGYSRALDRLMGILQAPVWVGRNRLTERAARAAVDPSPIHAPCYESDGAHGQRLVSPLDDVITAIRAGALKDVRSEELRANMTSFLKEVQDLLLIPEIVDRTINKSLHAMIARCWLTSWLDPTGWMARALVRSGKRLVRIFFGSSEDLATRAFGSIIHGADLSAPDFAGRVLGYRAERPLHRLMFLSMGRDVRPGLLQYDARQDRLVADLDLYHLAPRYSDEERIMADFAGALGGELRTNPAWAFLGKPISVHNQGGCPMSADPNLGVTTPDGQVHGCPGLYVLDGSLLCTSVGVNPSATITAIAERNILRFIKKQPEKGNWPHVEPLDEGAAEYLSHRRKAKGWSDDAVKYKWSIEPPVRPAKQPVTPPLGLGFSEVMQGFYLPGAPLPADDDGYREVESEGRPKHPVKLDLKMSVENLAAFFEDINHEMAIEGDVTIDLPGQRLGTYRTTGTLRLFVPRYKSYGIDRADNIRRTAHEHYNLHHAYTTVKGEPPRGEQRTMEYSLTLHDAPNGPWRIEGYKLIRDDPGLDAWRDTSSLFIRLLSSAANGNGAPGNGGAQPVVRGAGAVHTDLVGFLYKQLPSLHVIPGAGVDPARSVWAILKFATFFFGTLQRIYAPEVWRTIEGLFKPLASRQSPPFVSN